MDRKDIRERITYLFNEIYPITQHNDFEILPTAYDAVRDIFYIEVMPVSAPEWARVAYEFSRGGIKYDRGSDVFGIDGQPRVSYSGQVWVRYIGDFEDGSRVAFHICSQQPSHSDAEEQLSRLYGLWQERDGLEPIEVFRKFF